jgi:hypothetical protein
MLERGICNVGNDVRLMFDTFEARVQGSRRNAFEPGLL